MCYESITYVESKGLNFYWSLSKALLSFNPSNSPFGWLNIQYYPISRFSEHLKRMHNVILERSLIERSIP